MVEKVQRPLVSRLVHVREESPGSSEQDSQYSLGRGKLEESRTGGGNGNGMVGRPAAANAARERNRVQTLRHAFLELQRTLPSVPPDTKLSKLDVLILATTYIAHLTRSLQEEDESSHNHPSTSPSSSNSLSPDLLGSLHSGDGYLHPVKLKETPSNRNGLGTGQTRKREHFPGRRPHILKMAHEIQTLHWSLGAVPPPVNRV